MEEISTRVQKWSKYREKIKSDINVINDIINDNKEFSDLKKRIWDRIPSFSFSTNFSMSHPLHLRNEVHYEPGDVTKLKEICDYISIEEHSNDLLEYISELEFSTHYLDNTISELRSKSNKILRVSGRKTEKISISQIKYLDLNPKQEEEVQDV